MVESRGLLGLGVGVWGLGLQGLPWYGAEAMKVIIEIVFERLVGCEVLLWPDILPPPPPPKKKKKPEP